MNKKLILPEQKFLIALLDYNPESGALLWKGWRGGTARAGVLAGKINAMGYRQVKVRRISYSASRIIWKLVYGVDPKEEIDHINGIRDDNRITNLREATRNENCQNRTIKSNNKAKMKGVHIIKCKNFPFQSRITVDGKCLHLGCFLTAELAHKEYLSAAERLHGKFVRIRKVVCS